MTREATSRPNWSVPIQCDVDGGGEAVGDVLLQRRVRREPEGGERSR